MNIKAAIFDIDGTLLPFGAAQPSAATVKALKELRKKGIAVIIATGRALFNAKTALGAVKADYYVCVNGNWITDAVGRTLYENTLSTEKMYCLVDYCEDYDLPLNFIFNDAYHVYVEYAAYCDVYSKVEEDTSCMCDGEDQTRHLISMPYAASTVMDEADVQAFQNKYGYLGLNFVPFGQDNYDVLRTGSHKTAGIGKLLEKLGIDLSETAAFGDGANDAELLGAACFYVAMANGNANLQEIADVVAPDSADDGVAQIIYRYLL